MRTPRRSRGDKAFQPVVLRGTLPADIFERVVSDRADVVVVVRREFRSIAVSVLPKEGARYCPAGTKIRAIALAIIPSG